MILTNSFDSLYGSFRTRTFADIFPSFEDFLDEYNVSPLANHSLETQNLEILYYQLYASYGNSHIASSDENQFKYQVYSIILNKGTQWQKSLEIQSKLQGLTDDQIMQSVNYINNHAYNPGEGGESTTGDTILQYINEQTATKQKLPYVESMARYMQSLVDVTTTFIKEFKKLFIVIVNPELPLWYNEEEC